eukprot:6113764-Amphidinium_carterae.1
MDTSRGVVLPSGTQMPLNEFLPVMIVRPRPGSMTSLVEGAGLGYRHPGSNRLSGEPMRIQYRL